MIKSYVVLFSTFLSLTACVYGPKLKNKTAYLNGKNYKNTGLPVAVTKRRKSKITGIVFYKLADSINFNYSSAYKVVLKNRANQVIDEYVLDRKGEFNFTGFLPNGDYLLEVTKGEETAKLKRIKLTGYMAGPIEIML